MVPGFEGKNSLQRSPTDSLKLDEGEMEHSAERIANNLIAQHPEFTNEQLSVWTVPDDTIEIRQRLLRWNAGEDPECTEAPLIQRIAYAKEYLKRLAKGI